MAKSDKVYTEIYYQYKNNEILLNENYSKNPLNSRKYPKVEEDLLNLIAYFILKSKNFQNAPLNEAWRKLSRKNVKYSKTDDS